MYASWTMVTSVVMRVTSDDVINLSIFAKEYFCIAANISLRKFFAIPQEAVAEVKPAAVPKVNEIAAIKIKISP